MNDRYLFRAKRTDNSEWVEGFLFQLRYDSTFCWCIGNEPLSPNDYSELYGFNREWFYIDESTICQCTGIPDKNRNVIWENDVVYMRCNGLSGFGKVIYENGCFWVDDKKRGRRYPFSNHDVKYRVDGNIFDNPELLEQEE